MKALEIFKNVPKEKNYPLFSEPPDLLPLTFGRDVMDENDLAQLTCIAAKGDEPMTVSWTFHGNNISSDLGIITTPIGGRGSLLVISAITFKHGGKYTCIAKNDAGVRHQTVELKVNGRYYQEGTVNILFYFI